MINVVISHLPGVISQLYPPVGISRASHMALGVKNLPAKAGDERAVSTIPESGISPRVGNGNPLPVFLLRKSRGQRSLVCYSPQGRIELDTAEQLTVHFMTSVSKRV